jgi:hypothetical protein
MASKLKRLLTEWEKIFAYMYIRQRTDNQDTEGALRTKLPQKSMIQ